MRTCKRKIDIAKRAATICACFWLSAFASNAFGQEEIKPFPQNVDIRKFTNCRCHDDTIKIKQTVWYRYMEEEDDKYPNRDYSLFRFADLNGDGVCEILHYFSSSLRGWPYDYLTIYMMKDTLTKIGDFPSFLLNFAESDGHFLQINSGTIGGHKTNPIYYNSVLRFNGKEYSLFYDPSMTKGEFSAKGLAAYKSKNYKKAYIYFNNALLTPHHSYGEKLQSANDVAIALIKLNRFDEVQPLLLPYIGEQSSSNANAAAYYNIGLAMEKLNNDKEAIVNFIKSCKLKETDACKAKIMEVESRMKK
jgi:tetratricopeptide (TPR) repeat protein